MKKTLQQLIEKVTGTDKLVDEATQAVFEQWAELPEPDLSAAHYLTRYVVLATADQQLYACAIEENGLTIASAAELLTNENIAFSGVQAFVLFLQKSPLVVFRADHMQGLLAKHLPAPWHDPDVFAAWLDLAVLLPELFSGGPGPNATLSDWLAYFDLSIERDSAASEALACARLFLCVLAKASQQGVSTPADLLKLEKARRWLWSH